MVICYKGYRFWPVLLLLSGLYLVECGSMHRRQRYQEEEEEERPALRSPSRRRLMEDQYGEKEMDGGAGQPMDGEGPEAEGELGQTPPDAPRTPGPGLQQDDLYPEEYEIEVAPCETSTALGTCSKGAKEKCFITRVIAYVVTMSVLVFIAVLTCLVCLAARKRKRELCDKYKRKKRDCSSQEYDSFFINFLNDTRSSPLMSEIEKIITKDEYKKLATRDKDNKKKDQKENKPKTKDSRTKKNNLPPPLVFDRPGQICKNVEKIIEDCMRKNVKRTFSEPCKKKIQRLKWSVEKTSATEDKSLSDSLSMTEDKKLKQKITKALKQLKPKKPNKVQKRKAYPTKSSSGTKQEAVLEKKYVGKHASQNNVTAKGGGTIQSQLKLLKPSLSDDKSKVEDLINMCVEALRQPFREKFLEPVAQTKTTQSTALNVTRPEDSIAYIDWMMNEYLKVFNTLMAGQAVPRKKVTEKGVKVGEGTQGGALVPVQGAGGALVRVGTGPQGALLGTGPQAALLGTGPQAALLGSHRSLSQGSNRHLRRIYRDMEKAIKRWSEAMKKLRSELESDTLSYDGDVSD